MSRRGWCSGPGNPRTACSRSSAASTMPDEVRVPIASDVDVGGGRLRGRGLADQAGFSRGDQTVVAAAISEIARNILMYAKRGEISLNVVTNGDRQGVVVVARDQGPGIRDVARAMQDGYSTSGGLGLCLPCAKRLMDDFEWASLVGQGTTVSVQKW